MGREISELDEKIKELQEKLAEIVKNGENAVNTPLGVPAQAAARDIEAEIAKYLVMQQFGIPDGKGLVASFGSGGESETITVTKPDGRNFKGGFSTALADFNNDGIEEIVTSAGSGGGPHVRLFDQTGKVLRQFFAYEISFSGGVEVAAADLDKDGQTEIITVPKSKKSKIVRIFNQDNSIKKEFIAFKESSTQANLALSDINADGQKEIVVINKFSDRAEVKVFNSNGSEIEKFTVEAPAGNTVQVLVGNFYGDSRSEFAAFIQGNGVSKIYFYSPGGNLELAWQLIENFSAVSKLAMADINNNGRLEFLFPLFANGRKHLRRSHL